MPSKVYQQKPIAILIKSIRAQDLRENWPNGPNATYVRILVDGDTVAETFAVSDSSNPSWSFEEPLKMHVYASSSLAVCVHRVHNDTLVASLKGDLLNFVEDSSKKKLKRSGEGYVQVDVNIDPSTVGQRDRAALSVPSLNAPGSAQNIHATMSPFSVVGTGSVATARLIVGTCEQGAKFALRQTCEQCLDSLQYISEEMAAHPETGKAYMVAWILLATVFKAISLESSKGDIRAILVTVCDTLSNGKEYVRSTRNPDAACIIKRLALLVAQAAVLMDEYLKHSTLTQVIGWAHFHDLKKCEGKLKDMSAQLLHSNTLVTSRHSPITATPLRLTAPPPQQVL